MSDVVAAFTEVLVTINAEDVDGMCRVRASGCPGFAHAGRRIIRGIVFSICLLAFAAM